MADIPCGTNESPKDSREGRTQCEPRESLSDSILFALNVNF